MKEFPIHNYLPHREPMLLLDGLIDVAANSSRTRTKITEHCSFFRAGLGVPSWIGIEYMGQTAACIAGFQLAEGQVEPHIGLLLGSRKYQAFTPWFKPNQELEILCMESSVVGGELASFDCQIIDKHIREVLAKAKLTVFRKPLGGAI